MTTSTSTTTGTTKAKGSTASTASTGASTSGPSPAPPTRRLLEIPPPAGRTEVPVRNALDVLEAARAGDLAKAQKVIEDNGLTIEVVRLRDRLARAPLTDVQRLLLAAPGVAEQLFLRAIADQIPQAVPPPPTLDELADKFGTTDVLSERIAAILASPEFAGNLSKAIAQGLRDAGGGGSYPAGAKGADSGRGSAS